MISTIKALGAIGAAALTFATGAASVATTVAQTAPADEQASVTVVQNTSPWVEKLCQAEGYCQKEAHSGDGGDDVYALCPVEQADDSCASGEDGWAEDTLPGVLTYWTDTRGGDLHTFDLDGHTGCWISVADTSLVACPDGTVEQS